MLLAINILMTANEQSEIEKFLSEERYKEEGGSEPLQQYAIIEWL